MTDVQTEFLRAARAAGCLQHGDAVVLGVSGGADSLSMLHLFAGCQAVLGIRPHVLHLNHHIRGEDADADAAFVARVCRDWDVPCRVAEADVLALARKERLTVEDAARQARYKELIEEAARVGAKVIAVAHNSDDQAETVLMHFLRGSGLAGLRGMLPVTPLNEFRFLTSPGNLVLLRPLLGITRAEIEAYCAVNSLTHRIDQTNLDTAYTRNRLRREVIPLLEAISPGLRGRLAQTASIAGADVEQIAHDTDAVWPALVISATTSRIVLDISRWQALSLSLKRASIRRAFAQLNGSLSNLGFAHTDNVVSVTEHGAVGTQISLPGGLTLQVGYDAVVIAAAADHVPAPEWPLLDAGMETTVSAPGQIELASGWRFELTPYIGARSGPAWDALLADPWSAALSLPADLRAGLCLRVRRQGERFQPQGAGGSQQIHKFMINAKIPAQWRDRIPVLAAGDQVVWLCGWRVDERFIVTPETQEVWLARFERVLK